MASTSEFSRTLSLLRQERGVSQRTAASDLGISQGSDDAAQSSPPHRTSWKRRS